VDPLRKHADPVVDAEFRNVYRLLTAMLDQQGVVLSGTAPSDPSGARIRWWWDTVNNKLFFWNDSAWKQAHPAVLG
jgi:hypothetical protein